MGSSHVVIMGVSGCGKSTVSRALAERLKRPFIEGDDFHPSINVEKMRAGKALDNSDRQDWITALCRVANRGPSAIIACSALNERVRSWLDAGLDHKPVYVWLEVSETVLADRLDMRVDHFFDPSLLRSQFDSFERPNTAIRINGQAPLPDIICEIESRLNHQ